MEIGRLLTFPQFHAHNRFTLHRLFSILLLLGFLALGTGLLENLHLQTHLQDHAATKLTPEDPGHSDPIESNCQLCLQLHLPTLSTAWVPLLVCLGLIVAFLTLLAPRLTPQRIAAHIDCRGPPPKTTWTKSPRTS